MSDTLLESGRASSGTVLTHLCEEFQQVIERIQDATSDVACRGLGPDCLLRVEAAERCVDARARALQRGLGDRSAWRAALSDYETTWLDVFERPGERRN